MNRHLFWKILLGFAFTILFITQGLWGIFALLLLLPQQWQAAYDLQRVPALVASPAFRSIPPEFFILSLIGGLMFSAILAYYVTWPMRKIRTGFGELAKGDFSVRLGPGIGRRRDEIANLARDFDVMAQRLDEMVKARDTLLATVSHELRSPLTRLQMAIALLRQDPTRLEFSLQCIGRESARLEEMVDEFLTLSKLESGIRHADEYFDLVEILRLVSEDARFEAVPAGIEVTVGVLPARGRSEWICRGSGKLIRRALENIVRNALRFSRAGQRVAILLSELDTGHFQLVVSDEGPGVPADLLGRLFLPFVQGPGTGGPGFGLGLTIAQRAILAHGGTLTAHNGPEKGLVVTACLSAARMETMGAA